MLYFIRLLAIALLISSCSSTEVRFVASKRMSPEKEKVDYDAGVEKWQALRLAQSPACSPKLDSIELLRGHKTKIAVVIFHGYSQNPEKVKHLVEFFGKYDVNILAPRLSHHYNVTLADLDKVKREDWIEQTEKVYAAAQKLGYSVVVVGYSLGGVLAARLAVAHPESTMAGVFLSPAWRVTGKVDAGTNLGWLFKINGNKFLGTAPACDSDKPFVSPSSGAEVDEVGENMEYVYKGSYPSTEMSVLRRMASETPVFLAVVERDDVINSDAARDVLEQTDSGFRTVLVYKGSDHSTLISPAANDLSYIEEESSTPHESAHLFDQITEFLEDQASMTPMTAPLPEPKP